MAIVGSGATPWSKRYARVEGWLDWAADMAASRRVSGSGGGVDVMTAWRPERSPVDAAEVMREERVVWGVWATRFPRGCEAGIVDEELSE